IPVAGNTITQEIAKALGVSFQEAEELKRKIGFVALGGVTATEDEQADRASKCIRGVVTRLHAEVNRSINFYRSQQGGSAPSRVLLTGGSASLRHLDTFFREKLRIDVDYLNPFVSVQIGPHVDSGRASAEFLQLAEICGLALRRSGLGHVEINLMPPNLVQKKTFRKQAPVLIASSVFFAAAAAILFLAGSEKARTAEEERDAVQEKVAGLERMAKNVAAKVGEREEVARDLDKYRSLLLSREGVLKSIDAIRVSMLPGTWISSLESCELSVESADESGDTATAKVPGYRIVIRGFLDVLRKVEAEARSGKTAAEIFCIQLTDIRRPFKSATIKGQRESGADNLAEFTVEAVLRAPLSALEEAELAGKAAK
ncbi:MAG: pilus assembly protein PilM, partial [Kiritimatiellae bacterium]|nr:pilus assembly protein PilM [Kiritimatiellia bacterium]